eukprot:scaffold72760_cov54-Phaeocystis_antarctica.AAC.1
MPHALARTHTHANIHETRPTPVVPHSAPRPALSPPTRPGPLAATPSPCDSVRGCDIFIGRRPASPRRPPRRPLWGSLHMLPGVPYTVRARYIGAKTLEEMPRRTTFVRAALAQHSTCPASMDPSRAQCVHSAYAHAH